MADTLSDWFRTLSGPFAAPPPPEPNPTETKLQLEARDNFYDIIQGVVQKGTPLASPNLDLVPNYNDKFADQIINWNRLTGLRTGKVDLEETHRNRYVMEHSNSQAILNEQGAGLYGVWYANQSAQVETPLGRALSEQFGRAFPPFNDPSFRGISHADHFNQRFGHLQTLLYLLKEQGASPHERQVAFESAMIDWLDPNNKRFQGVAGSPGSDTPRASLNLASIPIEGNPRLLADPSRVFDIYTRWFTSGAAEKDPSDPRRLTFMDDGDRKIYDALQGDHFFNYYRQKQQFYTSRYRYEQLTRQSLPRAGQKKLVAIPEKYRSLTDDISSIPDRTDFKISDLSPISPVARWLTEAGKNVETAQAQWFAKTRDNPNWFRELNPFAQVMDKEPGLPPPIISDYFGEYALPALTLLASAKAGPAASRIGPGRFAVSPVGIGIWGAWMLGLFEPLQRGAERLVQTFGAGRQAIETLVGLEPIPTDRIKNWPGALGAWVKSQIGTPSLETMTLRQAHNWLADHYGTNNPDEMARFLQTAVPMSTYLKNFLDRASEKLPFPFYPLGNEQLGAQLSHFFGDPVDDLTVAAMYLGAGPALKTLSKGLYGGVTFEPKIVKTPLEKVVPSDYPLERSVSNRLYPTMLREASFNAVLNAFKNVRNVADAREILVRAEQEAANLGPLTPDFAAKLKTAFDALSKHAQRYGPTREITLSPDAIDSLRAISEPIAMLGATQAHFAITGEFAYFGPSESARFAQDFANLGRALDQGKYVPPTTPGGRLLGSFGKVGRVNLTNILRVVARKREILERQRLATPLIDTAISDLTNETPLLSKEQSGLESILKDFVTSQHTAISTFLRRLVDNDAGRGTRNVPHPDFASPLYEKINRIRGKGLRGMNDYENFTPDEILRVGGKPLVDEIARFPGLKGNLIRSSASSWFARASTPSIESIPARPGGPRPDLYAAIERILRDNPDNLVLLSKHHLDALNEHAQSPLNFDHMFEDVAAYRRRLKFVTDRLSLINDEGGILQQLVALKDRTAAWWKDPVKDWNIPGSWQIQSVPRRFPFQRDPDAYPFNPEARDLRGTSYKPPTKNPFQMSKQLKKFLEDHFSEPAAKNSLQSTFRDLDSPLISGDISSYRALRRLFDRVEYDADIMSRGDRLAAHMRRLGKSEAEIDRAVVSKGLQQIGYLDMLHLTEQARQTPKALDWITRNKWKNAYIWAVNSRAREAEGLLSDIRIKTRRLQRWISGRRLLGLRGPRYGPEDAMKVIDEMAEGKFSNPALQGYYQRLLFDLNAHSFRSGAISEKDFYRFYSDTAYYHGVFDKNPSHATITEPGARNLPIPGRFRLLEDHPYTYSFKIPEKEGEFYVTWRHPKALRATQYRGGFSSYERAVEWLESSDAARTIPGKALVAIKPNWPRSLKRAAGLVQEPVRSLAELSQTTSENNVAHMYTNALRSSPFTMPPDQANMFLKTGTDTSFTHPTTGRIWLKMTNPYAPALENWFVDEQAVQWLSHLKPNMLYLQEFLRAFQDATGYHLPDTVSYKNPLIPLADRIWGVTIGNHPIPRRLATVVGGASQLLGNSLVISKVLLSLPSYAKQLSSMLLFNLPAMVAKYPFDPALWIDTMKFGSMGAQTYFFNKNPNADWAWEALFRNENIEFTKGSFSRQWAPIFKRNWESVRGLEVQLLQAKTDLANAPTASEAANILERYVSHIERQITIKRKAFLTDAFKQVGKIAWSPLQMILTGEGAVNDAFFAGFGFFDQLGKYIALRHLVERQGMSVDAALSRVDAFGQNLHRVPGPIRGLAATFGGTKFTTYPYNQLQNMGNILTQQPAWAISNLASLYFYNKSIRTLQGYDTEEDEEVYAKLNGYERTNWLTRLQHNFGRMYLPGGLGHMELDALWGVFNGYSPFARSTQELIAEGNGGTTSKAIQKALVGLVSHFGLGSVALSTFASIVSHRDPYGEPINTTDDAWRAMFKMLAPDTLPPWGRDYEFLFKGPDIDPKTNQPRPDAQYWLRRFFQIHPMSEMGSEARYKTAMDSVIKGAGAAGKFYGDLAYYDLLEVKARQRGGPIHADGTVDRTALNALVAEHYNQGEHQRSFPGLGDDEIPRTRDWPEIRRIAKEIQLPRILRTSNHMNAAMQIDAYAHWRTIDRAPLNPQFARSLERALGQKLSLRQVSNQTRAEITKVVRYWNEHADALPPGVIERIRGWGAAVAPR